jgi:predicted metal-binding membrane protein
VLGAALAVAALAWAWLWQMDATSATPGAAWSATDAALTFLMWVVMMVAMMAAPAAPAITLYAGMQRGRRNAAANLAVPAFAVGYAFVWIAFSAAATFAQWLLDRAELLTPEMATSSTRAGGAILALAGVYAWTPLHRACLRHCQSPLGFFMTHWRDGSLGALHMGVDHGVYCVGCCWALMAVLFAVGVMNLAWVAILTLIVLLLKLRSSGTALARVVGVALVALGTAMMIGDLRF